MKPKRESREEAAVAGRQKYISDAPCRNCGGRVRHTSNGACVPCMRETSKRHRAKFRELLEAAKTDNGEG